MTDEIIYNENGNAIITEEQFEIAKQHGISRENVRNRANKLERFTTMTEVLTRPLGKFRPKIHPEQKYIDKAEANGIGKLTYVSRRQIGWNKERAYTQPPRKYKRGESPHKEHQYIYKAEENGIKRSTYISRRAQLGWSKEEASTRPVQRRLQK